MSTYTVIHRDMDIPLHKPRVDDKICQEAGDRGITGIPWFKKDESRLPDAFRAFLYGLWMIYCFVGIAVGSDVFMNSIEMITSKVKIIEIPREEANLPPRRLAVKVWNDTISNLTLMALGSSAPEILINIIEIIALEFKAGDLGPSTIVGSAAFNLFVITSICVYAIPTPQVRIIKETDPYIVTASFSIGAYVWVYICLEQITPRVITLVEALVTFFMFPLIVILAYLADRGKFRPKEQQKPSIEVAIREGIENKRSDNEIAEEIEGDFVDDVDAEKGWNLGEGVLVSDRLVALLVGRTLVAPYATPTNNSVIITPDFMHTIFLQIRESHKAPTLAVVEKFMKSAVGSVNNQRKKLDVRKTLLSVKSSMVDSSSVAVAQSIHKRRSGTKSAAFGGGSSWSATEFDNVIKVSLGMAKQYFNGVLGMREVIVPVIRSPSKRVNDKCILVEFLTRYIPPEQHRREGLKSLVPEIDFKPVRINVVFGPDQHLIFVRIPIIRRWSIGEFLVEIQNPKLMQMKKATRPGQGYSFMLRTIDKTDMGAYNPAAGRIDIHRKGKYVLHSEFMEAVRGASADGTQEGSHNFAEDPLEGTHDQAAGEEEAHNSEMERTHGATMPRSANEKTSEADGDHEQEADTSLENTEGYYEGEFYFDVSKMRDVSRNLSDFSKMGADVVRRMSINRAIGKRTPSCSSSVNSTTASAGSRTNSKMRNGSSFRENQKIPVCGTLSAAVDRKLAEQFAKNSRASINSGTNVGSAQTQIEIDSVNIVNDALASQIPMVGTSSSCTNRMPIVGTSPASSSKAIPNSNPEVSSETRGSSRRGSTKRSTSPRPSAKGQSILPRELIKNTANHNPNNPGKRKSSRKAPQGGGDALYAYQEGRCPEQSSLSSDPPSERFPYLDPLVSSSNAAFTGTIHNHIPEQTRTTIRGTIERFHDIQNGEREFPMPPDTQSSYSTRGIHFSSSSASYPCDTSYQNSSWGMRMEPPYFPSPSEDSHVRRMSPAFPSSSEVAHVKAMQSKEHTDSVPTQGDQGTREGSHTTRAREDTREGTHNMRMEVRPLQNYNELFEQDGGLGSRVNVILGMHRTTLVRGNNVADIMTGADRGQLTAEDAKIAATRFNEILTVQRRVSLEGRGTAAGQHHSLLALINAEDGLGDEEEDDEMKPKEIDVAIFPVRAYMKQFCDAIAFGDADEDSDDDSDEKKLGKDGESLNNEAESEGEKAGGVMEFKTMKIIVYLLMLPWKLLFAIVVPTEVMGGWASFVISFTFIGVITAIVGDSAYMFGCLFNVKNELTAISFVALGTSVPDTFASMVSATKDEYADASIVNVTGSNSVNVFLGLGISWTLGALYWEYDSEGQYKIPEGPLGFSVSVFCMGASCCLFILYRRRVLFKGELGGPQFPKICTSLTLFGFWLLYLTLSYFKTYGGDNTFLGSFGILGYGGSTVALMYIFNAEIQTMQENGEPITSAEKREEMLRVTIQGEIQKAEKEGLDRGGSVHKTAGTERPGDSPSGANFSPEGHFAAPGGAEGVPKE